MSTFLSDRRARIATALTLGDAILLVGAGEPVPLPEGGRVARADAADVQTTE